MNAAILKGIIIINVHIAMWLHSKEIIILGSIFLSIIGLSIIGWGKGIINFPWIAASMWSRFSCGSSFYLPQLMQIWKNMGTTCDKVGASVATMVCYTWSRGTSTTTKISINGLGDQFWRWAICSMTGLIVCSVTVHTAISPFVSARISLYTTLYVCNYVWLSEQKLATFAHRLNSFYCPSL